MQARGLLPLLSHRNKGEFMKKLLVLPACALLLAAGSQAALIDFTDEDYESVIVGQYTDDDGHYTTGWFTVEGSDLKIKLTAAPKNKKLTWNHEHGLLTGDGIGIGNDELTGGVNELKVEFDQDVKIASIDLLDLYYENGNNKKIASEGEGYTEVGALSITGGESMIFYADVATDKSQSAYAYGTKHVAVNSAFWTTSASFNAPVEKSYLGTPVDFPGDNDYALARIEVTQSVPEPASLSLIVLGLTSLGLMSARRRKR